MKRNKLLLTIPSWVVGEFQKCNLITSRVVLSDKCRNIEKTCCTLMRFLIPRPFNMIQQNLYQLKETHECKSEIYQQVVLMYFS